MNCHMECEQFDIKHEEDLPSIKTEPQDIKCEIKTEPEFAEHIDVKPDIETISLLASSVNTMSEVDFAEEGLGKWLDDMNAEEAETKVIPCETITTGLQEEKCKDKANKHSRPKKSFLKCNKRSMCTETESKHLTCNICNKGTYIFSHIGNETFSCNFCCKIFSTDEIMRNTYIRTKEKSFKCNICDKSFSYNSQLKRHADVHTKPFICNFCAKTFSQKSYLVEHIRCYHSNEKPFKCNFCCKSFTQKSFLNDHIRVHTNEKPYTCDICNKSFSDDSNMRAHRRIHFNDKLYTCNICSDSFTLKSHLIQHKRIHTIKKFFKCDICRQSFSQNSELIQHASIHKWRSQINK